MPDLVRSPLADHADRDRFRAAIAALPAGPLRDVLVAVAYARDAAARTGAAAAPDDRWQAVVAAAERAADQGAVTEPLPAWLRPERAAFGARRAGLGCSARELELPRVS